VFNNIAVPGVAANMLWNDSTGSFQSAPRQSQNRLLSNVASVSARLVRQGAGVALSIMIADASGVYEALYTGANTDLLVANWMLPNEAYRVMRRDPMSGQPTAKNTPLRATYARRLDNGEVLIVNGFFGRNRGGQTSAGEILQVDGTANASGTISIPNYGFSSLSIRYELPPIEGARGLVLPVFADRR
jgi:hypothetical protein